MTMFNSYVSLPEGTLLKQSVPFSLCSSRHPVEWVDSPSRGFQTGRVGMENRGAFGRQRWIVDGSVQRGLSWFIMVHHGVLSTKNDEKKDIMVYHGLFDVFYPPKMMEKKE
jgi:hypothetical protein